MARRLRPADGWAVVVNFDVQERGKGNRPSLEKQATYAAVQDALLSDGATIGRDRDYATADLVARHARKRELWIVEVEGHSTGQPGDKVYSAVGQLLTRMRAGSGAKYGLAVHAELRTTALKIPTQVRKLLDITIFVVAADRIEEIPPA